MNVKPKPKEMKNLEKNLNALAKKMGFGRGLVSHAKLYKTTINTFTHREANMWFFTINLNVKNEVVGVSYNTTYFKENEQIRKINSIASFENPITFEQAIEILN